MISISNKLKEICVEILTSIPSKFDLKPVKKIREYKKLCNPIASVGEGTYGISNIIIHSWDIVHKVHIGKYCSIADNLHIFLGGNHRTNLVTQYPFSLDSSRDNLLGTKSFPPLSNGDIEIGNDVWVGSHVSIMSGVKIGSGSVIAAFSHVVKDVLPYEIVGGNPAKHIKFRFSRQTITDLLEIAWWDWEPDKILKNSKILLIKPSTKIIKELMQISKM